jgi:hypothetical protein
VDRHIGIFNTFLLLPSTENSEPLKIKKIRMNNTVFPLFTKTPPCSTHHQFYPSSCGFCCWLSKGAGLRKANGGLTEGLRSWLTEPLAEPPSPEPAGNGAHRRRALSFGGFRIQHRQNVRSSANRQRKQPIFFIQ